MKIVMAGVLLAIAVSAPGQATRPTTAPREVPDSTSAIIIAEQSLTKIYGKQLVISERPFSASLQDGIWHVIGTLYCKDKVGRVFTDRCVGGVAEADVRQNDGVVVRIGHGR